MRSQVDPRVLDTVAGVAGEAVVMAEEAAGFYQGFEQTAAARLQALLLPSWLSSATLTATQLSAVARAVGAAGTWDVLALHGGATLHGDFIRVAGLP